MAEANKTGIFAKASKRISRTKTKVLQTLGKAEKYTDEIFDDLVQKTEKQHDVTHHLQKEIKSYVSCVRALSTASKSLAAALSQTYEEEWTDEMDFKKMLEAQDLLFGDYLDSMQSAVMEPMNVYLASFPPLKVRTAKRGRKMTDFDNARHNLEVLQAARKRDEAKIAKAQEELTESKQIFDELHSELCTDLPNFYNGRITFYADIFQKMFSCERTLHSELATIFQHLTETSERLSKDHVQFVYTPKRPISKSLSDNEEQPLNGEASPQPGTDSPASSASPAVTPTTPTALPRPNPPTAAIRTSVAAAAYTGGGGAAVAKDKDRERADHVYGNQDAVMASTKVNGDVESSHKSKPLAEETKATPATGDAVKEGQGKDPSSTLCEDFPVAVRAASASAQLPALATTPCVDDWDNGTESLYLLPVPFASTLPTFACGAVPDASMYKEEVPDPSSEGKGVGQISDSVSLGIEKLEADELSTENSGEEEEERQEVEVSGQDVGEFGELCNISSIDCQVFIDCTYQQEIDTALKEEGRRTKSRETGLPAVQLESAVTGSFSNCVRQPHTGEASLTDAGTGVGGMDSEPYNCTSTLEACSEISSIPASVSDFETLVDSAEKKLQSERQIPKDPEQQEQAVCSQFIQPISAEGEPHQEWTGLSRDKRGEGLAVAAVCDAVSKASSEFLITSSFCDVSWSSQTLPCSPQGEVYDSIVFSSQEDILMHHCGAAIGQHGVNAEEKAAAGCTMSAEERNAVNTMEQAIRDASSPNLLSAGGGGPSQSLMPGVPFYDVCHGFDLYGMAACEEGLLSRDEGVYENVDYDWKPVLQSMQCTREGNSQAHQQCSTGTDILQGRAHLLAEHRLADVSEVDYFPGTGSDLVNDEINGSKDPSSVDTSVDPACLRTLPRDPVPGVMLKPPVFLISPTALVPQERRETPPRKEGIAMGNSEEGRRGLGHRSFEMVKNILHISGKGKGQKGTGRTTKSVEFSTPESTAGHSEDIRRRKRSSPARSPPDSDAASFKKKIYSASLLSTQAYAGFEGATPKTSLEEFAENENSPAIKPGYAGCRSYDDNLTQWDTPFGLRGLRSGQAAGDDCSEGTGMTMGMVSGGSSSGSQSSGLTDGDRTGPQTNQGSQPVPSSLQVQALPGTSALSHDPVPRFEFGTSSPRLTEPQLSVSGLMSLPSVGFQPAKSPKSSGHSLNPLAPPFMMPTTTVGPTSGVTAAFTPSFSFPPPPSPASDVYTHWSDSSVLQTVSPYTRTDRYKTGFPSDVKMFVTPSFSSMQGTKFVKERRRDESFLLPQHTGSGNLSILSSMQQNFQGRRTHVVPQPGPNKRFLRPPLSFRMPFQPRPQAPLEGWWWGQDHRGDVAALSAVAIGSMHTSVVKAGDVDSMSKIGEGDVFTQLLAAPAPALLKQSPAVMTTTSTTGIIQTKEGLGVSLQKPSQPTPSSETAAHPAFDLDTAREAWRKAWRASSLPDNSTQDSAKTGSKQGSSPTVLPVRLVQTATRNAAVASMANSPDVREVPIYEDTTQPLPVVHSALEDGSLDTETQVYVAMQGTGCSDSMTIVKSYEDTKPVCKPPTSPSSSSTQTVVAHQTEDTEETVTGKAALSHGEEHLSLSSVDVEKNSFEGHSNEDMLYGDFAGMPSNLAECDACMSVTACQTAVSLGLDKSQAAVAACDEPAVSLEPDVKPHVSGKSDSEQRVCVGSSDKGSSKPSVPSGLDHHAGSPSLICAQLSDLKTVLSLESAVAGFNQQNLQECDSTGGELRTSSYNLEPMQTPADPTGSEYTAFPGYAAVKLTETDRVTNLEISEEQPVASVSSAELTHTPDSCSAFVNTGKPQSSSPTSISFQRTTDPGITGEGKFKENLFPEENQHHTKAFIMEKVEKHCYLSVGFDAVGEGSKSSQSQSTFRGEANKDDVNSISETFACEGDRPSSCQYQGSSNMQELNDGVRESQDTPSLVSLENSTAVDQDRFTDSQYDTGLLQREGSPKCYIDSEERGSVSADLGHSSLTPSESDGRVNSMTDTSSVDGVRSCDSAINKLWEAVECSRASTVKARTSSEMVLGYDSDTGSPTISHNISELSDATNLASSEQASLLDMDLTHYVDTSFPHDMSSPLLGSSREERNFTLKAMDVQSRIEPMDPVQGDFDEALIPEERPSAAAANVALDLCRTDQKTMEKSELKLEHSWDCRDCPVELNQSVGQEESTAVHERAYEDCALADEATGTVLKVIRTFPQGDSRMTRKSPTAVCGQDLRTVAEKEKIKTKTSTTLFSTDLGNKSSPPGPTSQIEASHTVLHHCEIAKECIGFDMGGNVSIIDGRAQNRPVVYPKKSASEDERDSELQDDQVTYQMTYSGDRDTADMVTETESLDGVGDFAARSCRQVLDHNAENKAQETVDRTERNTIVKRTVCQKTDMVQPELREITTGQECGNDDKKHKQFNQMSSTKQASARAGLMAGDEVSFAPELAFKENVSTVDEVEHHTGDDHVNQGVEVLDCEASQDSVKAEIKEPADFHECSDLNAEMKKCVDNEGEFCNDAEKNLDTASQEGSENVSAPAADQDKDSKLSFEADENRNLKQPAQKLTIIENEGATQKEPPYRVDPGQTDYAAQTSSLWEEDGSEGFEVTDLVEEESMDVAENFWRVVDLGRDCDQTAESQRGAQAAFSTHNGPESSLTVEGSGSNVYEAPPRTTGDNEDTSEEEGDLYQSPPSNKPVYEPPPSTLYQVEATHAYLGEDIDELSFDPGDIVYVVPFDNEDEQDDGWQMGIKQRDGLKGVFPENFTRRL